MDNVLSSRDSTHIGAYLQDELVRLIQLVHGDNIAIISQILSMRARKMKDALPLWLKRPLFPVYNWVSRTRMRIKTRSMPMS